jgi:hypothetical protein
MNRYYVLVINNQRCAPRASPAQFGEPVFKEWGWLLPQTCQGFELPWFRSSARKLQMQQAFAASAKLTIRASVLHAAAVTS